MNSRVVGMLLGAVLIPIAGAYQVWDTNKNYTEVQANLISFSQDCYLERNHVEFRSPGSDVPAYVDCRKAASFAAENGYAAADIQKHARLTYSYISPLDKAKNTADYELWRFDAAADIIESKRTIYISNDADARIRWSKNFIF